MVVAAFSTSISQKRIYFFNFTPEGMFTDLREGGAQREADRQTSIGCLLSVPVP